MKVVLSTGCPESGFLEVFGLLQQAGVVAAAPCQQGILNAINLQAQILTSHEIDLNTSAALTQLQPGKVWSQLAADLFMTNLQHPTWGWADPQTCVLLDFWADFDRQVRLLLVYNSPQAHLAQVLPPHTVPSAQVIAAALDEWARWNTALLRYTHRHPARCLLVNAESALTQPDALVKKLTSEWQLAGLNPNAPSSSITAGLSSLQFHLINALIDPHHPARVLFEELEVAAQLPNAPQAVDGSVAAAWATWVEVQAQLAQAAKRVAQHASQNAQLQNELAQQQMQASGLTEERSNLVQTSERLQAEHIALRHQLEQQAAQLAQAQQEAVSNTQLREESELLLLQLHQVQEELEVYFVKNQALEQQGGKISQLQHELVQYQAQAEHLTQDRGNLIQTIERLQVEQVNLRQQLDQQAAQLALALHDAATSAQERGTLVQTTERLQAERAHLSQQFERQVAQLAHAQQEAVSNTQLREESELLLLQLHQVQQELEHYFMRAQDLEKQAHAKAAYFVTDFWLTHQPTEIVLDMRKDIACANWYPAESDGRWAGPALLATVQMPPVQSGHYTLELDVVDAMDLDIVKTLVIEVYGESHAVEVQFPMYQEEYPLLCAANLSLPAEVAAQSWRIDLRFRRVVSPAEHGSDDLRQLALRLRTLRLIKQA